MNRFSTKKKWRRLSEKGEALLKQLEGDSRSWLGRGPRIVKSLHTLGELGEPAAIPVIVDFLLDSDTTVAREASRVVQKLLGGIPLTLLPALDERVRAENLWAAVGNHWRMVPGDPWASLTATALDAATRNGENTLLLGLASFHRNGRVRERAVSRLNQQVKSGLEIPFLLLRLNDWVDVVRNAAEQAIGRRLIVSCRPAILECLPLVARLSGRYRSRRSAMLARIQTFLEEDISALAAAATESRDSGARHYGLLLAWAAASAKGEAAQCGVIEQTLECENPAVRLKAAVWLANIKTPLALSRRFLPGLLRDPTLAVRRVAFGWCATREPQAYLEHLRAALLDPSAVIRAVGQFYLPKQEPIDLRLFYRDSVGTADQRLLKAALGGLGETGRPEDADLLVPLLNAHAIGVRKAALAALARLALKEHLELFVKALQDDSPGVSRAARIALEPSASMVGRERLTAIFAGAVHHHVRVQVLSLGYRLSRWETLPLLVQANAEPDEALKIMAADMLRAWSRGHNTTYFVGPSEGQVAQFRAALTAYGARLQPELARQLRTFASSLSPLPNASGR